jgi:hypothetical protein
VVLLGNSAVRENEQPAAERIWSASQAKSNPILYPVFVAPDVDFDRMRPAFDRILRSFST